ncbi:MAG: response regulator [Symploca sp. SIO2E9]|nr:response regulator [Symploca sp. SIO2E9]
MNSNQAPEAKSKILIVDDKPDNLRLLSKMLSTHGYEVRRAINASTALMGVQAAPPDLILLDIRMPDMNGYELCQKLKAIEQTREIPVIFLSALNEVLDKVKAFEAGCADYITKPFQIQEVLARVENQLTIRRQKALLQKEICERKQVEKALRQSKTLLNQTVRITKVGGWSIDLVSKECFWTQEVSQILELSVEFQLNDSMESIDFYLSFYSPTAQPVIREAFRNALEDGKPYDLELPLITAKNNHRWVRTTAQTVYEQGNSLRVFGNIMDITERKQAEEALRLSEARERDRATQLELTLSELKRTQARLIQTEKMSSLGQMVAGVAHEINNPVSFIYGNLIPASEYASDLIRLIETYQQTYPNPTPEIKDLIEEIDLDFLMEDWQKLMNSMQVGAERIHEIVLSLRNFSRLNQLEKEYIDIHDGLDKTLLILNHRLRAVGDRSKIEVIKNYGELPPVNCYNSQLNQVFMNLLNNAIDALSESNDNDSNSRSNNQRESITSKIWIHTEKISEQLLTEKLKTEEKVVIRIIDNGPGMNEQVQKQIFDPFFTTKPVGRGTGLGLAISYQIIVEKHGGHLSCVSAPGQGTEFIVEIPIGNT